MSLTCKQPDRHEPRIVCGYPLPCPFHTAVIDTATDEVKIPVRMGNLGAARDIAIAASLRGPSCVYCARYDKTTRKRSPRARRPDGEVFELVVGEVDCCDTCCHLAAHRAGMTYVEGT